MVDPDLVHLAMEAHSGDATQHRPEQRDEGGDDQGDDAPGDQCVFPDGDAGKAVELTRQVELGRV